MSVNVDLDELAAKIGEYGFAYLVSVSAEGQAHVVAVTPDVVDGGVLLGGIGKKTSANLAANATATLVWPPVDPGGYSLLVDGTATSDAEAATVTVSPTRAILHRPAPGEDGKRVGNDCRDISLNPL